MCFLSDGFFFLDYSAGMRFNLVALIMQRVPTLGVGVAARTQATRFAARKTVNLHTSLLDLIGNDSSLFPFLFLSLQEGVLLVRRIQVDFISSRCWPLK